MLQEKKTVLLLALCSALTACEGAPSGDITAPKSETRVLDAQSATPLAASNTWTATHSMLQPRAAPVAGTINNIIYVVGGYHLTGPPSHTFFASTTTVQAYDVATNTWSVKQPLPGPRSFLNGASAINGRLYVTGGDNDAGPTKSLFVYTPGTDSWPRKADMPLAGESGAQGAIAGQLYVYEITHQPDIEHAFFRYNPSTNTWVTLVPPATAHPNPAAGVIDGKFYLVGGYVSGVGFSATLDVYDPVTNTWTTKAPMRQPREQPASAVINGQLFVAGGSGGSFLHPSPTLQVYDASTNTWALKAPMPSKRIQAAGTAANGLFFVLGGTDGNQNVLETVRTYTP